MSGWLDKLGKAAEWLDAEDDPHQPAYDPVHLGATLVATLIAVGVLYWVLWTAFVYEGGIFLKIGALLSRSSDPDALDGWLGNVGGLIAAALIAASLASIYKQAARKAAKR